MRYLSIVATVLAVLALLLGIVLARHEGDPILGIETHHHVTPTTHLQGKSVAPADGGHAIIPPPPGTDTKRPKTLPRAGFTYVNHIYAKDLSGYDFSAAINGAAKEYGLYAPGLLAIIMSECNLQTHSPQCDRYIPPYDISFGCCQITVSTGSEFGVGNGIADGYYGSNVSYVRNYENVPSQGVYLAARVLHYYSTYTGLGFPDLALAWNCGPGGVHPVYGSQCWMNHQAFLSWYNVALQYAIGYDPNGGPPPPPPTPRPTPTPFPQKSWGTLPHLQNGKLTWAASNYHKRFGHYQGERFIQGRHRGGNYMVYAFRHADLYCHFNSGRCNATMR